MAINIAHLRQLARHAGAFPHGGREHYETDLAFDFLLLGGDGRAC